MIQEAVNEIYALNVMMMQDLKGQLETRKSEITQRWTAATNLQELKYQEGKLDLCNEVITFCDAIINKYSKNEGEMNT